MKKIVMPIVSKDYFTTAGRVAYIAKYLARDFHVDFFTTTQDVFDDITGKLKDIENIEVHRPEIEFLNLSFSFRDEQAAIFVHHTYNMSMPGTNLKIWEIAAFDDFWGHLSNCSFKGLRQISADFILLPLMSREDHPADDADVFYTTIVTRAKEAGIKLIGYQLYPVFSSLLLMPRLMDAVIVRDDYERQFYEKSGIQSGKIHVLTDTKDRYSLSSIEDIYMNSIYNDQIEIRRDELSVVVCNHDKFRPQMKAIFNILGKAGMPIVLSLIKREFVVRDLSEDQIIEGLYHDDIRKIAVRFYQVEHESVAPMIMISDLVISPAFVSPLEFAVRYGKRAAVFNPSADKMPDVKGVVFIRTEDELKSLVQKTYKEKRSATGVTEILDRISKGQ